jgi:hypothetical protein
VKVKNGRAAHIAHFSDALVLPLPHNLLAAGLEAALWNRNYFLRFRFLLLKSYGTVLVPAPYLDHKKQTFQEKFWNFFAFLHRNEKVYKFQQIYCKM